MLFSLYCVNPQCFTDGGNDSKSNPSCFVPPALQGTSRQHNHFCISHFTDSLTSLPKKYKATSCTLFYFANVPAGAKCIPWSNLFESEALVKAIWTRYQCRTIVHLITNSKRKNFIKQSRLKKRNKGICMFLFKFFRFLWLIYSFLQIHVNQCTWIITVTQRNKK